MRDVSGRMIPVVFGSGSYPLFWPTARLLCQRVFPNPFKSRPRFLPRVTYARVLSEMNFARDRFLFRWLELLEMLFAPLLLLLLQNSFFFNQYFWLVQKHGLFLFRYVIYDFVQSKLHLSLFPVLECISNISKLGTRMRKFFSKELKRKLLIKKKREI